MSAEQVGRAAAAAPGPGAWRVEVERFGWGVHVVADQAAAVRLADAAPGNVWLERVDVVAGAEVLDAAAVERMVAEGAW